MCAGRKRESLAALAVARRLHARCPSCVAARPQPATAAPCEVRPSDRVVFDGISMIRHQPDDPCEETLEWVVTWPEKAKLPSVVHSFTTAELKERDPEGGCIFSGKLRQLKSRPLAQQITFDPRGPKDK